MGRGAPMEQECITHSLPRRRKPLTFLNRNSICWRPNFFWFLDRKIWFFPEKATYIVLLPRNHTKKATYIAFLNQNSIFLYPKLFWFATGKIWFFSEKATYIAFLPPNHTKKRQLPLPFWIKTLLFDVLNLFWFLTDKNMIFLGKGNLHCLFST